MFLVGFMASGKSSVGQELARRWGWDFVDLDPRIEARQQKSIPRIFREDGEAAFRAAETAALKELLHSLSRNSVVALGGGAFIQQANRELLRSWPTVFLESPVDELWERSLKHPLERPLCKDRQQFERLYEERLPCYRQASLVLDTAGKDPASVCADLEVALRPTGVHDPSSPANSELGESR